MDMEDLRQRLAAILGEVEREVVDWVNIDAIALRLNQRPRKNLAFETPADKLQAVLQ